jgi:hypothetical protein
MANGSEESSIVLKVISAGRFPPSRGIKPRAMHRRLFRRPIALILCVWALSAPSQARAQTGADRDRIECEGNLRLVWEAIQEYRREHKDVPHSLSELSPKYISDPAPLICPVARREGKRQARDPRTSYLYEFSLKPITLSPTVTRTQREWKRRQMGRLGSVVPICRCDNHGSDHYINLSFGGPIYSSALYWEKNYKHLVKISEMDDLLFKDDQPFAPLARLTVLLPFRPLTMDPRLIDLSQHYNTSLGHTWKLRDGFYSLANVPTRLQTKNGIEFDSRGMIRLDAPKSGPGRAAGAPTCIDIGQTGSRARLLLGVIGKFPDNTPVGRCAFHYGEGDPVIHEIRYGKHVMGWEDENATKTGSGPKLAWRRTGLNKSRLAPSLYEVSWDLNAAAKLEAIEVTSSIDDAGLFIVAITLEK